MLSNEKFKEYWITLETDKLKTIWKEMAFEIKKRDFSVKKVENDTKKECILNGYEEIVECRKCLEKQAVRNMFMHQIKNKYTGHLIVIYECINSNDCDIKAKERIDEILQKKNEEKDKFRNSSNLTKEAKAEYMFEINFEDVKEIPGTFLGYIPYIHEPTGLIICWSLNRNDPHWYQVDEDNADLLRNLWHKKYVHNLYM